MARRDEEFNPRNSKAMDPNSFATRPGRLPISEARLRRMVPQAYAIQPWMFWARKTRGIYEFFKQGAMEQLKYGLAEAAIVVDLKPLQIAAFTNEIDCIAMLMFLDDVRPHPEYGAYYPEGLAKELIARHSLKEGMHLLAVNTFTPLTAEGYEPDLLPGPKARGVYGNFRPFIAEFMALDLQAVERTKGLIEETEWQRAEHLANTYDENMVDYGVAPRDGRPHVSHIGNKQNWKPGVRAF